MNKPALPSALIAAALSLGLAASAATAEGAGGTGAGEAAGALYAPDGRLLQAGGSGELLAGAGSVMWTEEGGLLMLRHYSAEGRLARVERYDGDELVAAETYFYDDAVLQAIEREAMRLKSLVRERYDQSGRLTLAEGYEGGRLRYTERRGYDGEGRLLSIARDEHGADGVSALLVERSYADTGALALEKRSRNGLPLLVTAWSAQGEYVEEHYDEGALFARVYYRENKKYREEIIQGGTVVRERVF